MEVSIDGVSVMIGMPLLGAPELKTTASLVRTVQEAAKIGLPVEVNFTQGLMPYVRDYVLADFLSSSAQKLFWIDGDMVWTPNDFFKFVAFSTRVDVVCAAYPMKRNASNQFVILSDNPAPGHPELNLVEVHSVGMGFTVWDRKVCEALYNSKPLVRDGMTGRTCAEVFSLAHRNGERHSEDVNAFKDIRALGFKVWMDPEMSLGHIGKWKWEGSPAELLKRKEA